MNVNWDDHFSISQWVAHIASGGAIIGWLVGFLPLIFALIPVVFYLIQIYETKTVQNWIHRRRHRKITRLEEKLKKLKPHDDRHRHS